MTNLRNVPFSPPTRVGAAFDGQLLLAAPVVYPNVRTITTNFFNLAVLSQCPQLESLFVLSGHREAARLVQGAVFYKKISTALQKVPNLKVLQITFPGVKLRATLPEGAVPRLDT